jgi:hypothetical protein
MNMSKKNARKDRASKKGGNAYSRLKPSERERLAAFVAQSYYDDAELIASMMLKRCDDEEVIRWQNAAEWVKNLKK